MLLLLFFTACGGQQKKVIFIPDTTDNSRNIPDPFDSWEVTESQNGRGAAGIPEWVRLYFNDAVNEIEGLDRFNGKYIFIGENRGNNFSALQQWANGFSVEQDLPRLVTQRVERKLVASASLYPDDEYGEYYEFLIREMSNGEFLEAVKEQTFWLKRKITVRNAETDDNAGANSVTVTERYEFLVLISVDKETLQKQIQGIMMRIKTKISPTREQAAAIARVKSTLFEGF